MIVPKLVAQGVILRLDGEKLVVTPKSPLTNEQREFLRKHKPQIIRELESAIQPDPEPAGKYTLWFYQLDTRLPGFTRMGLMTDDQEEAQKQLAEIYGKPVINLHRKGSDGACRTRDEGAYPQTRTGDDCDDCDGLSNTQDKYKYPGAEDAF